jgi:hypothetical protein
MPTLADRWLGGERHRVGGRTRRTVEPDPLVRLVHIGDRRIGSAYRYQAVGAAAILVHPRAQAHPRRRHLLGQPVPLGSHQYGPPRLFWTALQPVEPRAV